MFCNASCGLPISVGQPYHEGGKFEATISLINKYFSKCVILLCDSLQRHTMMIYGNYSEDTAYEKAISEGDLWLARNKDRYAGLSMPLEIHRWDRWHKSANYVYYNNIIEGLYKENMEFRNAVYCCAKKFVNHHMQLYGKEILLPRYDEAIKLCTSYLKEESSILLMWYEEKIDFRGF